MRWNRIIAGYNCAAGTAGLNIPPLRGGLQRETSRHDDPLRNFTDNCRDGAAAAIGTAEALYPRLLVRPQSKEKQFITCARGSAGWSLWPVFLAGH
jgi:hypothetical protein